MRGKKRRTEAKMSLIVCNMIACYREFRVVGKTLSYWFHNRTDFWQGTPFFQSRARSQEIRETYPEGMGERLVVGEKTSVG
jgi:hypothetical protein